ncbi:MAG: NUMOD4 domain-containing protein [Cyclobacteriaceae bacterium]|uniref:NUMOD4 domain-containing protein n=1 Tax=Reichenbachiella sp. TaxID=2184521 RepID=UPI003265078F
MANNNEEWKAIEGFSNYEVSSNGKIRSKARKTYHSGSKKEINIKGKPLKQRWHPKGKCFFLDLIDDDKRRRTIYPHVETANAFVDKENEDQTKVIHLDNNPRNNKASNLKWMTPSDHMKWQFEVGNKDNYKVWKTRKKRYKNGFKPDTVLPGRPRTKNLLD